MPLDRGDTLLFDVARHDARERAPQIRGQLVHRQIAMQTQLSHRRVRHFEGLLEGLADPQQPVEVVRIGMLAAEFAHVVEAAIHDPRDFSRIVDHDPQPIGRLRTERADQELPDLLEVRGAALRTRQHHREGLRRVRRIQQYSEQIKDFLKKTSKTPVPQPLEYLINDVAKRHGRLRVGMAQTYIRCEDEGLLTQILHDKKLESLRFRKLAPQVLVCDFEAGDVIATLREANYLPAAENANGILISAPAIRRAKSRPRPPRVLSETSTPNEIVIKAAVRTLRTGEKASSHKPREVPRTTANETLDLLHQYIEEQASLTIGYADTNGGVSNRLIDPISISLGTLIARDHATGEMQSFRIPRITGVSPAK